MRGLKFEDIANGKALTELAIGHLYESLRFEQSKQKLASILLAEGLSQIGGGFDGHPNAAWSSVAVAPSPATSGLTLGVTPGDGAMFAGTPFEATIWPNGTVPLRSNLEIARVTGRSTDTLTLVRAQEGTSARAITVGDQIAATYTAKPFLDIEAFLPYTTAGDLAYATSASAAARVPIGTVGQIFTVVNPTTPGWANNTAITIIGPKVTPRTVAGTTTSTDLSNGELIVPAGAMDTNKHLRLFMMGNFSVTNAALSVSVPRLQFVYGTQTLLDTGVANTGSMGIPTTAGWSLIADIVEVTSGTSGTIQAKFEWWMGTLAAGSMGGNAWSLVTGVGRQSGGGQWVGQAITQGAPVINTGAQQVISLNTINPSNDATYSMQLTFARGVIV